MLFRSAITSHRKNATEPEGSYAIAEMRPAGAGEVKQEVKKEEAEAAPVRELTPALPPSVHQDAPMGEAIVAAAVAGGPVQPVPRPQRLPILPVEPKMRIVVIGTDGEVELFVSPTDTIKKLVQHYADEFWLTLSVNAQVRLRTENWHVLDGHMLLGDCSIKEFDRLTVVGLDEQFFMQDAANKSV